LTGIRCAFDFAFETKPKKLPVPIALIDFSVQGYAYYTLLLTTESLVHQKQGPPDAGPDLARGYLLDHVVGTWKRVEIVVDLRQRLASVSFDGVAALGASVPLTAPGAGAGRVSLKLGVRYTDPDDAFAFRYDNVTCDYLGP